MLKERKETLVYFFFPGVYLQDFSYFFKVIVLGISPSVPSEDVILFFFHKDSEIFQKKNPIGVPLEFQIFIPEIID